MCELDTSEQSSGRSLVPGGAGSGGAADSRVGRRDSNFGALHAAANFTSGRRKQLNYKLQLQLNSFDDSSFYTYGTLDGSRLSAFLSVGLKM